MKLFFYLSTVSVNKYAGSCNTIDNPYAWQYVLNKVKSDEDEVFNLISVVNETRFLVQLESCEWKRELNESACKSKQNILSWWMFVCKYKELDDSGSCQNDYMRNPSTRQCNKACKTDEYLYIKIVHAKNV